MKLVWDERKRLANLDKHGMDFADLNILFFESSTIVEAKNGRLMAIGHLNGAITVVFAILGTSAISIISMRPASAKERKLL
nr:BrnT family toxin [Methyloferula stellata]